MSRTEGPETFSASVIVPCKVLQEEQQVRLLSMMPWEKEHMMDAGTSLQPPEEGNTLPGCLSSRVALIHTPGAAHHCRSSTTDGQQGVLCVRVGCLDVNHHLCFSYI